MLKDAGRGDMIAKFLSGGLSRRPLQATAEMLPTGSIGKGIVGMQRGAPGNRMAAGLVQELQGRRVAPSHPWYQRVVNNRGKLQQAPVGNANLLKAAALMGVSRMIPMAGKALSRKAPIVARVGGGGQSLASQMRQAAKVPARPIAPNPGSVPALAPGMRPVQPPAQITQPSNIYRPMPLVSPVNLNSTFDTSALWGLPQKMASLRATPLARLIASVAARHVQF